MRPSIARANEQLDPQQQLANTPPPHSTTPGLHPVSIHQMAPPDRTYYCGLLLIYRPRQDERLSWPSWLTCSGRFTHITVHSSDTGWAQDRESSPAKDRRSTTVPCHILISMGNDRQPIRIFNTNHTALFAFVFENWQRDKFSVSEPCRSLPVVIGPRHRSINSTRCRTSYSRCIISCSHR